MQCLQGHPAAALGQRARRQYPCLKAPHHPSRAAGSSQKGKWRPQVQLRCMKNMSCRYVVFLHHVCCKQHKLHRPLLQYSAGLACSNPQDQPSSCHACTILYKLRLPSEVSLPSVAMTDAYAYNCQMLSVLAYKRCFDGQLCLCSSYYGTATYNQ